MTNAIPALSEVTIVRIHKNNTKPITICVIYRQPNSSLPQFNDFFRELNPCLTTQFNNSHLIIMGDFNINLMHTSSNKRSGSFDLGKHKLLLTCKENNLWQLMKGPTHNNGSLIDHIYTNQKSKCEINGHFPYAGSDHDLCYVFIKNQKLQLPPRIIEYRNYKNINEDELRKDISKFDLAEQLPISTSYQTCDDNFNNFNLHLMSVLDKHAPVKRRLVKGKVTPWFTSEVAELSRKLRKEQRNIRLDPTISKKTYNILRQSRNNLLQKNKQHYFQRQLSKELESSDMWSAVDKLTNFRTPEVSKIDCIKVNDECIKSKEQINSLLSQEFIVPPQSDPNLNQIQNEIIEYGTNFDYQNSSPSDTYPIVLSEDEILMNIKSLKPSSNKLYPPTKILKTFATTITTFLCVYFMQFINNNRLPTSFKNATIVPVFKNKGSRQSASNYRPISLLTDYCKLFEKVLAQRLAIRVDSMLSDHQYAYRRNRSCSSALAKFTNSIYSSLDKPKGKTVAAFIDLRKAFDSVNHSLLLKKLMTSFQIEPWYINTLNETYRNRTFNIKNSAEYNAFPNGICQGSALSSLLFSLFINDIGRDLNCEFILYADDLVIYSHGSCVDSLLKTISENLVKVNNWCTLNHVQINFSKSNFMIFHKEKDASINDFSAIQVIKCNEQSIERVYQFKYLGVNIDASLNFNTHFKYILQKVTNKLKFLHGIKRFVPVNIMKTLINAYILSIIDFSIEIWCIIPELKLNRLQNAIDHLLLSYSSPSLFKRKKYICLDLRDNYVKQLRVKFDLLTIKERSVFVTLKNAFKLFVTKREAYFPNLTNNMTFPRVIIDKHRTEFFKRSLLYRSKSLWNQLPREWDFYQLSYDKFKMIVREWLINNRN